MSASAVGVTLLPVRAIHKRAVKRGELAVNPTADLELPAVRGGRDRIAAPDECSRLLVALPEADRPLWATAMYAGLRRGELMALRVEDVNLAAGTIHVRRSWDPSDGEIAPKSAKGDRRVPVPAVLRDYLDQHLIALPWPAGLVFGRSAASPFDPDITYSTSTSLDMNGTRSCCLPSTAHIGHSSSTRHHALAPPWPARRAEREVENGFLDPQPGAAHARHHAVDCAFETFAAARTSKLLRSIPSRSRRRPTRPTPRSWSAPARSTSASPTSRRPSSPGLRAWMSCPSARWSRPR